MFLPQYMHILYMYCGVWLAVFLKYMFLIEHCESGKAICEDLNLMEKT